MSMACETCQRTPLTHGVTLYRVNETGVPGIWRCEDHLHIRVGFDLIEVVEDLKECIRELREDT